MQDIFSLVSNKEDFSWGREGAYTYASMVAIMTGGTVTNGGSKNILLLSTAAYLIKQLLLTNYCISLNSSRTGYFFFKHKLQ